MTQNLHMAGKKAKSHPENHRVILRKYEMSYERFVFQQIT